MEVDETTQHTERDKFENRSTFIEHIDNEMQLMEAFFKNFSHYMFKARSGLRNLSSTDSKAFSDRVLADRFIHSD